MAISILIENYFPDKAIVVGDFDSDEVTEAVNWLEKIFKQKFERPILADKKRLFYKLKSKFTDQDLIKNFYHYYRGDQNDMMHYLFKKLGRKTVSEWLKDYLKAREYTVHSKGTIDLYVLWLNESKDLESLVKMACIDLDGLRYQIKDFIEVLNDIWIFVFDEYRDYFDRFEEFDKEELEAESEEGETNITEAGKQLTEETWSKLDQIENIDIINFLIFMYYGHVDDRLFNLFRDYMTQNADFLEAELKKYQII